MGILNVTPDSFYDGGRFSDVNAAVGRAAEMAEEGADFIDIGGESTRPGSDPVSAEMEISRVVPVIQSVSRLIDVPISIDTRKSQVAEAALRAGADLVNDVGGLNDDPDMADVVARHQVPVVIMHKRGVPKTMQDRIEYGDLLGEIRNFFGLAVEKAEKKGVPRHRVLLDPGIGFGKSVEDNFMLIRHLNIFADFGCPILIGVSRKSFIGKTLNLPEKDRLHGTAAAVAVAAFMGAHVVRVHDVREMVQVVRIVDRIKSEGVPAHE
jgi:dihydropteroate synthase